jgi:hypothetical protein
MSKQLVLNPSPAAREVSVVDPDGKKTSVFIQPNSKVKLAEGWTVCPDFLSRNLVIKTRELK